LAMGPEPKANFEAVVQGLAPTLDAVFWLHKSGFRGKLFMPMDDCQTCGKGLDKRVAEQIYP